MQFHLILYSKEEGTEHYSTEESLHESKEESTEHYSTEESLRGGKEESTEQYSTEESLRGREYVESTEQTNRHFTHSSMKYMGCGS